MAKLNEYLGGIISSFSKAKVMSDLQSAMIAKEYLKHPLLKEFSIPRMKIEDVEMTIPVAINMIDIHDNKIGPINIPKLTDTIFNLTIKTVKLSEDLLQKITSNLKNKIQTGLKEMESRLNMTGDITSIRSFVNEITKHIQTELINLSTRNTKYKKYEAKIYLQLKDEIEKLLLSEVYIIDDKDKFANLEVIMETHQLKDIKPENLINIKLKITEESMEWNISETKDGEVTSKLLPE